MNSFLALRFFVVALTLALAVVLIARGSVLIGVLIGALALSRLVMVLMIRRRRRAFAQRFPRGRRNDA